MKFAVIMVMVAVACTVAPAQSQSGYVRPSVPRPTAGISTQSYIPSAASTLASNRPTMASSLSSRGGLASGLASLAGRTTVASIPAPNNYARSYPFESGSYAAQLEAQSKLAAQSAYPRSGNAVGQEELQKMTDRWQDAVTDAAMATGMDKVGTWSINDMVHSLQNTFTNLAASNETDVVKPNNTVPFEVFASDLLCKQGLKLTNCSGNNPCKGYKCGAGSMCLVDQCGGCTAKCVSFLEMGATVNKLMGAVGMKGIVPGVKSSTPTPNFPIVDKIASGVQNLARTVLPKCQDLNQILDVSQLRCKNCTDGSVAQPGATTCTVCGRGKYADVRLGSCKSCNPGFYSSSMTGNRFCTPCAVNTYNSKYGSSTCWKCPAGSWTRNRKGASTCTKIDATN